jgi:hypothetical protein
MPGLVPGIHDCKRVPIKRRGWPDKRGHDEAEKFGARDTWSLQRNNWRQT